MCYKKRLTMKLWYFCIISRARSKVFNHRYVFSIQNVENSFKHLSSKDVSFLFFLLCWMSISRWSWRCNTRHRRCWSSRSIIFLWGNFFHKFLLRFLWLYSSFRSCFCQTSIMSTRHRILWRWSTCSSFIFNLISRHTVGKSIRC